MQSEIIENKAVVKRFNKEFIEQGNMDSFYELMDDYFINHTAMPGVNSGPAGMLYVFNELLRPAFSHLTVTMLDQVAEGDKVTTRKTITGTHTGTFMGVAPTQKQVVIDEIDIVRIHNGRYLEQWGISTLSTVAAALAKEK